MPLYNVLSRGMKLPSIGKIRKGVQVPVMDGDKPKKKNGQIVTRPKEMPWFVFKCSESTNVPEGQNEIESQLYSLYGTNQIRSLNVFLAYPDAFQSFSFWLEAYNFNQLIARSDERVIQYLYDVESQETLIKDGILVRHSSKPKSAAGQIVKDIEIGKPVPHNPDMILGQAKESGNPIRFKAVGRLTVVIRELKRLATFTLVTGGYWYDIPQINSTIQIVDAITKATGRGANTIPLILRRVEREGTYTDDSGAKKKKVRHDVELEVRPDIISGLLETYNESPFALSIQNNQPVLPSNVALDHVEEEFENDDNVVDAENDTDEPMDYTTAAQVIIKTNSGAEKFVSELTKEQLTRIVNSDKSTPEQKEAARVVLSTPQHWV